MNVHKNARQTPSGRVLMIARIESGWSVRQAAAASGVSERTAHVWLNRWRSGDRQLQDRSSAPHRCPHRLGENQIERIAQLRRERRTSPAIARILGLAVSTVGVVLRRLGLNRLDRLEVPAPVIRYERARPGEMIHLDIKSLGRIARGRSTSAAIPSVYRSLHWPTPTCSILLWPQERDP
jgi:transposase